MKKNLHPSYHEIEVVMTNGEVFKIGSTWGKPGDSLHLQVDPHCHIVWTQKHHVIDRGRVAKFNKRFEGLKFEGS